MQRCISPCGATAIPTTIYQGSTVSEHQDKVDMLAGISSPPPPVPYDGGEGEEGPPGRAFEKIDDFRVRRAFQGTTARRARAPMGFPPWPSAPC